MPVHAVQTTMGLLYRLHNMVKCVCVEGFGSNGFVTKVLSFPMDGHYRMDIISGVGHPKSNLAMPLVLCMIACNGWGTDIVLQVPRDSTNLAQKG